MTTSVHWRTPNLTVIDSRGLSIRQVAYLRKVAADPVETLIGRQRYDVAGRLLEQWDPRLFGVVPNMATVYRLSGEPLKVDSVDAGWRLSLPGLSGEELQRWDQRGSHWRTTYDRQLRPIVVEEIDTPNVETFSYADDSADPAFNRRGQLTGQLDRSGTLSFDSYSLLGQPLRETRTLVEGPPYRSSRMYSPIGTVLSQTDAGEHQQQSRYDIAGQLKQVELRIKGSPNWQLVLKDAQYNAAGQIIEQRAGNDVLSTWTYDPADGRLATQQAQKNAEPALQDLEYFYDRVGNITRLEDHTFQPIYFANQLVDGHRDFTYDSLYRLTRASGCDDAPPSDIPGRPLPGDPNNRLNYTQHYEYDAGNNLIELRHVRAGASHTRAMFIDPGSNRGVRWKEGDPAPVFPALFDVHGNLQALQPGKTLTWNSLDQLEAVTLVNRDNGPNDQEYYRYSQGVRVYKRHETHTSSLTHFQEVIYLPGLEIRTRDNGEELHVIILPGGHGSVRCLHWVSGQPANVANDQVRYSLDDHLGSSTLELDQQAQVISQEGYYPFGATAWYARGSELDVDYKTIRYSGKEMDDSGLYYYGARYYAPWLQRWVSADPAGDVDGLNLFGFVGNNPLNYFDENGAERSPAELRASLNEYVSLLSVVSQRADRAIYQLYNMTRTRDIYKRSGLKLGFTAVSLSAQAVTATTAGMLAATATAPLGPVAAVAAVVAGAAAADITSNALDEAAKNTRFGYPLLPGSGDFSLESLNKTANITPFSALEEVQELVSKYDPRTAEGIKETAIVAGVGLADKGFKYASHLEKALGFLRLGIQVTEALNDSFGQRDLDVIRDELTALLSHLDEQEDLANVALTELENSGHEGEAAGTLKVLREAELVTSGRIIRVLDLTDRMSQYLMKKNAA
ncbi:insecticidal toxin complex protein TccC [Pseudomonas frederiksbergensis]|uniref:Insecticidal toxin complex protein TccC n=1 Tax=Pseudomonas frederiksbergensis TaxID=104087 RepID=A0A1H5IKK4_9PSED|nr:RHS repeat-associated core domain-containing protein [Pseudomonas frederiksbergensis]SEE40759.1 insecticidal toxin complex protein TccC [Pseudomonas frederiksbergensis]